MKDKPFIKLLKSPYGFYFYDVNKNRIVRISEQTYYYLDEWLTNDYPLNSNESIDKLKKFGFLSTYHVCEIEHPQTKYLRDLLETKMHTLVLQVTQECNFRCSYCIYSENHNVMQRVHKAVSMDISMAKKAIDYFAAHSSAIALPYITFYGGEPLLKFELIKELVRYSKEMFRERGIGFSFTTNGSLLNEEIVEFCIENDIHFLLSLDGIEEIHDISRRYAKNGKGSFKKIWENINLIRNKYPDFWKSISVNVVVNQQYDYDEIMSLFKKPIFQELKQIRFADIDDIYSIEKTVYSPVFFEKMEYHRFMALMEYLEKGEYTGNDRLAEDLIWNQKSFADALTGQERLPEKSSPSGPCVPGQHKLFMNVNGDFFPCERVSELSESMRIGDIERGIDFEKVEELLNISKLTEENCKNCWAFIHCTLCVRNADNCGKLSGEFRASFCKQVRNSIKNKMKAYIMSEEYKRGILRR